MKKAAADAVAASVARIRRAGRPGDRADDHHDRMPATLSPDDYAKWFDAETELTNLHALLKPYPAELMAVSEASPLVNSPKNEGPQLLDPAA